MALVGLANILHHTGYSKDATVLLDASLIFLKDKRISWFTLGNVFAVSNCLGISSWKLYYSIAYSCSYCKSRYLSYFSQSFLKFLCLSVLSRV